MGTRMIIQESDMPSIAILCHPSAYRGEAVEECGEYGTLALDHGIDIHIRERLTHIVIEYIGVEAGKGDPQCHQESQGGHMHHKDYYRNIGTLTYTLNNAKEDNSHGCTSLRFGLTQAISALPPPME